jgi:phosphoserine phosphatase
MSSALTLWNDTAAKQSIIDYVAAVTTPGSPDFVLPADRIATFDNDGTLWLEKPMYIQLQHGLRAIGLMAAARQDVRDRQPFKAVYEKDTSWLLKVADDYAKGDPAGVFTLAAGIAEACEGITVEAFDADAREFLSTTLDSHFKVPYRQLVYAPMVELVHYLQDNGFNVWLTSGGGRDFMRAVCEELYDIPRSMAIGSSIATRYAEDEHGVAQVMRTAQIEQPIDDGPGKPEHIHRAIGRRPILAAGNSDGDIHMLKYAGGHEGRTLGVLVHHDDDDREYAYDDGARKALQLAHEQGWLVVSMKHDWKTVF